MKQITITLPDGEAARFIHSLLDLNVTFTVTTTVARDPLVLAAVETVEAPVEPPRDDGRKFSATVGKPVYADKRGRHVQRLTPDGRTSMQVVEAKVRQFNGKKFHMREIRALAPYAGFKEDTLTNQLQIMVARGRLVKLDKWTFREVVQGEKPAANVGSLPSMVPDLFEGVQ
jgi:hypothetical protein